MRQFHCEPTIYVTEIKETYFEIYTKQVSCLLASQLKYLSLYGKLFIIHDSYIAKFDYMNFAFAKLDVAW